MRALTLSPNKYKFSNNKENGHRNHSVAEKESFDINHTIERLNEFIILKFFSELFTTDNYRILLQGSKLILIISELRPIEQPVYLHNIDRRSLSHDAYERIQSVSVNLPEASYYLIKHYVVPRENSLKIVLGSL